MTSESTPTLPAMHYAPDAYDAQLADKANKISELLAPFNSPKPQVFASPTTGFRMRAEFRLWHDRSSEQPRCFYAMFDPAAPRDPIEIISYPIGCKAISDRMMPLLDAINREQALSHKLFQVEFLCSRDGDTLISLIYHRQLDEHWIALANKLATQIDASIIGRARKQRIVLQRDHIFEEADVEGRLFKYEQRENSFTQPNASINACMLNWAASQCQSQSHAERDFLELYCGNGNFTLPLAKHFRRALGTEISKTSIASANRNAALNGIDNTKFVRMSGEETASALRGDRSFRRLADIDIESYDFSTVLVDPPRAGLDEQTLSFIANFDNIIYISCNPNTLADNLNVLCNTHRIAASALFDQFPYTKHCEAGVALSRRYMN